MFDRLVWKLKRLLEKISFGRTRLASYAAALWLIKEERNFKGTDEELQESFLAFLETDWENDAKILKENYEGDMNKQTYSTLKEGLKDLPPHLQKLVKKIEKRQKDWNKQNPKAKIKTLVYNPETGRPDIEVEEGYQEIMNLADLIKSETDRLVKAAKKGDMKTVMAVYKAIGKIIK